MCAVHEGSGDERGTPAQRVSAVPRIDLADHVPARRSVPTRPDIQPRLYRPGGHVAVAEEHWRALVRRGLDPVYIDTSDEMLLFLFVVHLGSDGKMLKAHQHTYSTASRAMNFYIENRNRLPDISAGRLLMIADAIRDNRLDALDRMLTKTAVRDLQLEPSILQVILWPKRPPKRRPKEQARQDAPPRQPGPRTDVPEPHPTVWRCARTRAASSRAKPRADDRQGLHRWHPGPGRGLTRLLAHAIRR